ncbi:RES family NAD+ phosphorylase [Labilibaculum euxinus]|uniref:RES domain-containing protein n=1 Tax=Labilibaculum euxinus TaxID=2686357 RepID=A0A7M4D508_9BACT|nr:RES family NAD+ phosphorylase [Labilibaculum euxinus]MUP37737.1 RES domain-containing protein [Labilibaculum euxinus]MVB06942.1 RES domain-containing protein [Labilibaculum euxinus]
MKVCAHCFKDKELQSFIIASSTEIGQCNYCTDGTDTETIEIDELLDFFTELFNLFEKTEENQNILDLIQQDWKLFSDEVDSIRMLTDILNASQSHIKNIAQHVEYSFDILNCVNYWHVLKNILLGQRRFITDIEEIEELEWNRLLNQQVELKPDKSFYRSRIHKNANQDTFRVDQMGCPDKEFASAGRANPQGIPYLYLSDNPQTTLYETRSSYLDELSIGEFKSKNNQPILLVDFTEEPSIYFHIGNIKDFVKSTLLKRLISSDLSKPLRRYDSVLDYIPTQFICEYIRYMIGADGILFESSLHTEGKNLVIFDQNKLECVKVYKQQITNIQVQSQDI